MVEFCGTHTYGHIKRGKVGGGGAGIRVCVRDLWENNASQTHDKIRGFGPEVWGGGIVPLEYPLKFLNYTSFKS